MCSRHHTEEVSVWKWFSLNVRFRVISGSGDQSKVALLNTVAYAYEGIRFMRAWCDDLNSVLRM